MQYGKGFILSLVFFLHFFDSLSQDRCSTVPYQQMRRLKNPRLESPDSFEKWMNEKINNQRLEVFRTEETQSTYVIPVVVHVIHNGEPVGTGTNISDAQILSQISVLNKDYNRLNTDASLTPAEFLPVAGSLDIEFVLARQDPIGAPSNGIVRVQGTQTSWNRNDDAILKSMSYWPAENYLNIWVIRFSTNDLGYAQFPISSLPDLNDSPDDRLTDGVVISYTAFGSIDDGNFVLDSKYNKGRTATHEIGHFLGVYHIWGDDGTSCSGTDYVADTPNQAGSYLNQCPTSTRTSCSSNDMYMNYMDYTNDACMNVFTSGQIARMNVVLQNSPRRLSLLTSPGATQPGPIANDAGIKKILSPGTSACTGGIIPSIEVQNVGTNQLQSVRVQLKVNNSIIETKDFSLSINYLETAELNFNTYLPVTSTLLFSFEIIQTNGTSDGRTLNNKLEITTSISPEASLPITEIFNTIPVNWKIHNPDNLKTWEITSTSNGNSLFLNGFDYENQGAVDQLITPIIDLTNVTVAFLKFDKAYALYDNTYFERLRVLVSDQCNFSSSPEVVFDQAGASLATATTRTSYFIPAASEWRNEFISLSQYVGKKIQISFEATNGYGNNLYLDNVSIVSGAFADLAIESLVSPSPVTCNEQINPLLKLRNIGSVPISEATLKVSLNNQPVNGQLLSNLNLEPGQEMIVTVNPLSLQSGENTISFTVENPDGEADSNSSNDRLLSTVVYNKAAEIIPYRQDFNSSFQQQWTIVSQEDDLEWTNSNTNYQNSLQFNAFNYPKSGEESWLVSPVFDFSKNKEASLFFDVSYAYRFVENEHLKILISEDCGDNFSTTLYDKSGENLSTIVSLNSWLPSQENHWRKEYVNLSSYVGKSNLRFAFVANTNNGNNLYIDNIEFFVDDNPNPVKIKNSFSVYGPSNDVKLTFNLAERMPVSLQIYNSIGQLMLNNELPETLNQTYSFDLGTFSTGVYIFRVIMGNDVGAVRVVLSR